MAHEQVDLRQTDADFAAFSGHKAFGPMGIGFLYGKRDLLEQMEPFLRGGGMVDVAGERMASFNPIPAKFEAGTQNVSGAYGLSEALRYIEGIGLKGIAAYERSLLEYLLDCLAQFPRIRIYGNPCYADDRHGIVSFNYLGVNPHRVAELLDADGITIRAGAHCAQPLLGFLGVTAMCRVSLSLYNSKEDIQALMESLSTVVGRTHL
jgi:cysteine desulfurase/selenocysteine lyase